MRAVAITCVRNEGSYLIEWLAHHRAIGFDHFVVFSNDCDDTTCEILDHCARMGWLTHVPNPGPYANRGIQFTAMNSAAKMDVVKASDWICAFDVDEFINIKCGDKTLSDLLSALPDADAITLTWRLFGSGDRVWYEDTPVSETFTQAAPEIMHWPWRHAMFKTLYRNDGRYKKPGVHRPRAFSSDDHDLPIWFDGTGRRLPGRFATSGVFSPFGRPNYDLVQLNHYAVQSMAAFVVKAARGRVNVVQPEGILGLDYWVDRNFNQIEDRSILEFRNGQILRDEMMADPTIRQLHEMAVDWRQARIEELMGQEATRSLMGRLLQTPPSRILSTEDAKYLQAKAAAELK